MESRKVPKSSSKIYPAGHETKLREADPKARARGSSKNHIKKSVLRYAESSWGYTEIKQVSTQSLSGDQ